MAVSGDWSARREGWAPQNEDARDDGDIDYARVIHSASFRRLQGKTQILNLGDSDFYRTRLTHSLEVAQIAGGIARQLEKSFPGHPASPLLPDRSTIHSIGCTHDFGSRLRPHRLGKAEFPESIVSLASASETIGPA